MQLETVLETLQHAVGEYLAKADRAERMDRMETATYYQGMVDGLRYGMGAVEAALEELGKVYWVFHQLPISEDHPEWDLIVETPVRAKSLEDLCETFGKQELKWSRECYTVVEG